MTDTHKALIWAALILAAGVIAVANDLGTGAAFGIIAGLSGAALGTLHGGKTSRGACS